MTKKIAVLIRDRQGEALRMSAGLTLLDDVVDVFVLDSALEQTEKNMMNLELLEEMEMEVCTNNPENKGIKYLADEDIAQKLTTYDHVLAY